MSVKFSKLAVKTALVSLFCFSMATNAMADPFKNGYLAYNDGNFDKAIAIWTEGANRGHIESMGALVNIYENGVEGWDDIPDFRPNPVLAQKWRQKQDVQQVKDNHTQRVYERGIAAYDKENYTEAFPDLLDASKAGNDWAQSALAIQYYFGLGVEKSYGQAAFWANEAAERGHLYAQSQIGTLYYLGHGVDRNYSKALKWLKSAADSGETSSMVQLGVIHEEGKAVSRDFDKAAEYYKLAEARGNPDGTTYYNELKAASDRWHRRQREIEAHNARIRRQNAEARARRAQERAVVRQPYQYKSWTSNYSTPATPFGNSSSARRNWNRYNCNLSLGKVGC